MKRTLRLLLVVTSGLVPGLLAQAGADAPQRRSLPEPDWQAQLNDVFGVLLGYAAAVPFYNIGPWLGLSTDPQRRVDDAGRWTYERLELRGHEGAVRAALLSPTGRRVLTIGADRTARLWSAHPRDVHADTDVRQGAALTVLDPGGEISAAAFFPDGGEVALGLSSGVVVVYAIEPTAEGEGLVATETLRLAGHRGPVRSIAYSPDGTRLVTLDDASQAHVWDRYGNREGAAVGLSGHAGGIAGLHVANDGTILTVAAGDPAARVWNATGTLSGTIELGSPAHAQLAKLEDRDGVLRVVAPAEVEDMRAILDLSGTLVELERDPTSRWQATIEQLHVNLLDRETRDLIQLKAHDQPITGISFDPAGTRMFTTSEDGRAIVWEWLVRDPTGALVTTNVPFVVLWLVVAAVVFTIYMRFANVRLFGHALAVVAGKYDDPNDEGEVSHFQALSSALSGTVGLGNIAGVAIAIMVGGPGATVWMIVAGLLGMTLKFTECTLGQRYRKVDSEGHVSGGPMHYLKDGLQKRGLGVLGAPLAVVFTIFCIGGSLAGGNSFQVNQSLGILAGQVPFFEENGWVYGAIMAVLVGVVIIGGIRRIAQTAERIVPTMCVLYLLASLTIIVFNLQLVPHAFGAILGGAFSGEAMYGGALGALIMGFRRAAFSNEAGVGSASIAHSAARTPYPVREGIVALLEPFIDTVVVCTMTALVINITGVHEMPKYAELVANTEGAALTSAAFQTVPFLAGWFPWVLMGAVVLFAFSTMITWSYYGERCWTHLFGPRSSMVYKLLFLAFVVLGSVIQATNVLEFGDLMILLMAFPNIFGLYFLGAEVKAELREYEAGIDSGKIKAFR